MRDDVNNGGEPDDFDLSGFHSDDAGAKPEGEKPARPAKSASSAKPASAAPKREAPPRKAPGAYGAKRPAPGTRREGKPGGYPPRRDFDRRDDAGPRGAGPRSGPPRGGKPWERKSEGPGYGGPRAPRGEGSYGPRSDGPRVPRSDAPRGAGEGARRFPPREGGRDFRDGARAPRFREGGAERTFDRGPRPEGPRRFGPRPAAPGGVVAAYGAHKPASDEVKPYLPLKTEKGRYRESRFLLEGAKNIADALEVSPAMFHAVFLTEDFKEKDLVAALKKHRISLVTVTPDDIAALSDTETPQGIIAVANFATLKPDWTTAHFVTLLDAVQDPGNVGAIFRTSLALGMDALVLGKGTCDPYNAKVVRSSVGGLLRMPFETNEGLESKINFLRQKGFSIVASSSHARETVEQIKVRKKVALIVGNEGAGSGASFLDLADAVVKIPLKNKVESLNVSVAHGILAYQLLHGRQ